MPHAGVSRAGVIDRELDPSSAKRGQSAAQLRIVFDIVVLGDLQDDLIRRKPLQQVEETSSDYRPRRAVQAQVKGSARKNRLIAGECVAVYLHLDPGPDPPFARLGKPLV